MNHIQKMFKRLFIASALSISAQALAQTIPPLPGPITPSAKDSETFLCDVSSINEDPINRSSNLWTTAARGGKFQAVSPSKIRVMSESDATAVSDVYEFYKKYAAAAYIKSPMYDRGTRSTQKFVVSKCTVDSSRATRVNLEAAQLNSYKKPSTEKDHLLIFLAFNKTPLNDERIAEMFSDDLFSSDAFERRDQIKRYAASAKSESKKASHRFIILESDLQLAPYNFDKNTFSLPNLKMDAERYSYQAVTQGKTTPPNYDLIVPAVLLSYTPKSVESAKKIESARSKSQRLKLKTYVQVTEASNTRGPMIRATVAAIEVFSENNELLFNKTVK
jgi:hypothetical protein